MLRNEFWRSTGGGCGSFFRWHRQQMLPGYFVSIESQDENHVVQRSIYILMRVAMKSGNMPGMKNVFIDRTKTALLRFFVLTVLRFRGHNFKNYRLAFRDELSLIAWQFGEQRQFHPLQNRFNPPQMIPYVKIGKGRRATVLFKWAEIEVHLKKYFGVGFDVV
jgi:hypothetical protein